MALSTAGSKNMGSPRRKRLPLGRSRRRLSYENRLRLLLWLLAAPSFAFVTLLLTRGGAAISSIVIVLLALLLVWFLLQSWFFEQLLRPMQTLTNVVAALREEDYSFRARGGRRGDSLGDLALEINALAASLQQVRLTALESAALVRRVLQSIDAPVLAFDEKGFLRLLNPAAARLLRDSGGKALLGQHAQALGVESLLEAPDEQVLTLGTGPRPAQWIVRRSRFRESGVPHNLLLLSDISNALREEERQAWQRLIRVLGHEINNSLTPIKSLAGSMRGMAARGMSPTEFDRPLEVIEERAQSLHRFLDAYRKLAQLPAPQRQAAELAELVRKLAALEVRVPVEVEAAQAITVWIDSDQISQAVVNLLRNAADASLGNPVAAPRIRLALTSSQGWASISIRDSGLGVANPANLFVPFYTTKEQGTGIGLVLVKQIVEAHQGSIALTSHPQGGAVAELRLPL